MFLRRLCAGRTRRTHAARSLSLAVRNSRSAEVSERLSYSSPDPSILTARSAAQSRLNHYRSSVGSPCPSRALARRPPTKLIQPTVNQQSCQLHSDGGVNHWPKITLGFN